MLKFEKKNVEEMCKFKEKFPNGYKNLRRFKNNSPISKDFFAILKISKDFFRISKI